MPKGEKILAQSKRTAPPPNFKKSFFFSIGMTFNLVSPCVQKGGGNSIFKLNILKPSGTLRGEFIEREFYLVKGKAFETGGENFKSYKCFSRILFIYL